MRSDWIKIIHVAKQELALDDDWYRALLMDAAGVASSKEITTKNQFNAIMAAFRSAGFTSPAHTMRWRCSLKQQDAILSLWHQKARNKDRKALYAFMKRVAGVGSPDKLTVKSASKVILVLQKMTNIDNSVVSETSKIVNFRK